jgi:hypothetical protein
MKIKLILDKDQIKLYKKFFIWWILHSETFKNANEALCTAKILYGIKFKQSESNSTIPTLS